MANSTKAPRHTLSLAEVTRISGVKRRTVQLWAEAGVIIADPITERAGTGVHRRFPENEAYIAQAIAPFARMQISIGKLKAIAQAVRIIHVYKGPFNVEITVAENSLQAQIVYGNRPSLLIFT